MCYPSRKSRRRWKANRAHDRPGCTRSPGCTSGVLALTLLTAPALAASWDPIPGDGTLSGGSGTWDLVSPFWSNDGGLTNTTWVNGDAASFAGANGGIVTLVGGGATAGSITFDPTLSLSTYTLQSQTAGDVLTLSGGGQLVVNQDAAINAILGGSAGLTKLGGATLTLGGANTFSGPISVLGGKLRVADASNLGAASALAVSGGTFEAAGPLFFGGNVSIGPGAATIALANPSAAVLLSGIVSGNGSLTIDGTGGGALAITSPANFNGFSNAFTGNLSLVGGGSATLFHTIVAQAGQVYSASGGTLSLGGSLPGATVSLLAGSQAIASGNGAVQLSGRASGPGIGVAVAGDLTAVGGGRIEVGDGADDSGQIQLFNSAHLTADGGTIVLRPRATPLALDPTTVASLVIRNGGVLALAGNSDLVLNQDVDQSGAWVLNNRSGNTLRIIGTSQDTTAGLTLRAEAGVTRYEVDAINLGSEQVNGTLGVDLRGGTVDINNAAAGKTFSYSPGYVVSGWGQLGTSVSNQTHVIPLGGATFYASGPATSAATLSIVGGFNESAGSKAAFRIGDNNGLVLTVPNASAGTAYSVGSVSIDPQSAGSVAPLVANGGFVQANSAAFANANNNVRFEVAGGATLLSDVSQTGTLLLNAPGSVAINVSGGGAFITSSPTFLLKSGETVGGTGTLFGFNGATVTNLTLNGLVDLNGALGGSINGASTGTIKLDGGETLTLGAAADLSSMTLGYLGAGTATLEINAPSAVARLGIGTALTTPFGPFGGTREFKATAGTLQVDVSDPSSVSITGVNQLNANRGAGVATLGTLTLNGGAFQVGAGASTNTIAPGSILSGRGTFGHASALDNVINSGTVQAAGGQLTVSAATIRGGGTWDPNGQTLLLAGSVQDLGVGNPTVLRVAGSAAGRVQVGQTNGYTGGTVIDGSSGTSAVTLRVVAGGALGSGGVTLNGGVLQLNSDGNLSYTSTPVNVIGTAASGISYDRFSGTSTASRTHSIGALTLGGQTLNLTGPPTSAYNYTLNIASTTVSASGATIVNTSGSPVNTGPLTLNGNLNLALGSFSFTVGALSGTGSITRSAATGTLTLSKPANGYSGNLFTSVGTTNFTGSNTLGSGSYTFAGGTININSGGAAALNGVAGTMQGGQFNLNTANALDGTTLTLTGGNLSANSANSLGTGTIFVSGGKLFLKSDAGSTFGGAINVSGSVAGSVTVDRSSASGTGGVHTISSLNISNQQLNLAAGNLGYGLAVAGATTISGAAGSTIDNDAAQLTMPSLILNGSLTLTGTGNTTIGQLGGVAAFNQASAGTLTVTGSPLPGFASAVQVSTGTLSLSNTASLAGGSVNVNGGILNLGVANALAGTPVVLNSGFLNANGANALAGVTLPVSNGTLFAAANNSLGNATVNLTGGNVTATAPGALGSATINLNNAIVALRSDGPAAFGGSVNVIGSNFSTISVAKLTPGGTTGNVLSINNLSLGGQTLNVTGGDDDIFAVINPVTMSGASATTINPTAADALFIGALSGAGPLVKNGVRTLTLDGGGSFGVTTVNAGTLVVNNSWTTPGVSVGGSNGAATLQLGGGGVNSPGNLTINAGTLRIAKATPANAVPLASVLNVGNAGDVKVEYAGFFAGTLANNITVDTSLGARTLTLSSASGTSVAGQVSTFTYGGVVARSGINSLTVVAQADTTVDDGLGNLLRPASRLVLAGNQTFTTDLVHNGGIVIGKGNIPAGTTANPFGVSTNPLQLNVIDSTVGGMVADGLSSATFSKAVTTAGAISPRKRLGAFFNPGGAAGGQTINFNGSFTWNDGTLPLYVVTAAGNPGAASNVSSWNGMIVDPGAVLQINSGAVLDNVLAASGTSVTSAAPIYVGGGGIVRFNSGFDETSYRSLATAKGLAGTVSVLDNTTLQSNTGGHHFDGVELRTGTYQVGSVNQTLAGGLLVNGSPFDPTRTTSNLASDLNLTLSGVGPAKAFRIGAGQTLAKTGTGLVSVNGDQLHAPGAVLAVNQGAVNLNTDSGMNNGGAPVNNLSVAVNNGAIVNFGVTQHLAQMTVASGLAKLTSASPSGSRAIDATGVLASGGRLDLTNGRLIVDYAIGNSPMTSIRQQIVSGYNALGTLWGGNGIVSSSAAGDPTTGLGYGEASDLLGPAGGAFVGETVDDSAILVRYTKIGDANLDGSVGFNDLVRLAQNYNGGGGAATWAQGDFNYDGFVDFNDLVKLAQNYNGAVPGAAPGAPVSFDQDLAAAFAPAPEPGTIGLVGVAGIWGLARRQRRRGRIHWKA